jgi:hypothetical protein
VDEDLLKPCSFPNEFLEIPEEDGEGGMNPQLKCLDCGEGLSRTVCDECGQISFSAYVGTVDAL